MDVPWGMNLEMQYLEFMGIKQLLRHMQPATGSGARIDGEGVGRGISLLVLNMPQSRRAINLVKVALS